VPNASRLKDLLSLVATKAIRSVSRPNLSESNPDFEDDMQRHELWLSSDGEEGKQLNWSDKSLSNLFLQRRDLRKALLQRSDLREADFSSADLRGTDFLHANLVGASFSGAKIHEALFRCSSLESSDLSESLGASLATFGGADLTNARLPLPPFTVDIEPVKQGVSVCQRLILLNLVSTLYSLLTVAGTSDARLFASSTSVLLPILNTSVSVGAFYLVVPLVLSAVSIYGSISVQRTLEIVERCPALTPSGTQLDAQLGFGFLSALVRSRVCLLKTGSGLFTQVEAAIATYLIWWLVPSANVFIWLRYLHLREPMGTFLLTLLTSATLAVGLYFHASARWTPIDGLKKQTLGISRLSFINWISVFLFFASLFFLSSLAEDPRYCDQSSQRRNAHTFWQGA
jgi:Pentapeptide repeats (8 copies)